MEKYFNQIKNCPLFFGMQEEEVKSMTFEEFMGLHPAIKDDIYPNERGVLRSVDWAMLNELIETDKPLEQSHSLYWLLQSEKYRAAIKNG